MKKIFFILALLFMSVSSSFAGSYTLYAHGYNEYGCVEDINDVYINVNSYLNNVSLTGSISNVSECEAFYYVHAFFNNQFTTLHSFNYYYPYFDSSPTFTHSVPADYYYSINVGLGVYGADAQVQISWY